MSYSPFTRDNQTPSPPSTPAPNIRQRLRSLRTELGLLALCLFLFCWRLGDAPLFDLDEALYVSCAQQMVVSGDWITPRINTRQPERPDVTAIPFFEKPILVYWVSAGSMRVFGRNLWAARLPVAFAALLTTGAIVAFGRRWFGRRTGLLAGAVYATAPMTLVDARQMTTDGLLVLWFTLALFCFWNIFERGESGKRKGESNSGVLSPFAFRFFPFLFWLLCALAVLTKGIVGLLLPLLIISVYLVPARVLFRVRLRGAVGPRLRFALQLHPLPWAWQHFKRLRPMLGLLLLVAVVAPWHLRLMQSQERDAQGRTWVMEYIQRQHIGRFKGLDTVHNQPLPTYIIYFLLFFYPWAGFAPAAFRLRAAGRGEETGDTRYEIQEEKTEAGESRKARGERDRTQAEKTEDRPLSTINYQLSTFLLVWFWTLFVFFSLGAAKLPTYIAPAYPAAALLVGRWLDIVLIEAAQNGREHAREQEAVVRRQRSLARGVLCALCIGLLLLIALPFAPRFTPPSAPLPVGVLPFAWHLALTLTIGSGIAWLCFRRGGVKEERRRRKQYPETAAEQEAIGTANTTADSNRQSAIGNRQSYFGVYALIAMMGLIVALLGSEGHAVLRNSVLGPYQQASAAARPDAQHGIPIIYYNVLPRRPSMNFYAGYAPFEHKEVPLLPFLVRCLPQGGREADVVLTYDTYARLLTPEIAAVPGASLQLLLRRGPNGEWALVRITLPAPPLSTP